ncbi:low affinity immunoglobulin gamma Fc region receptor III-like [Archocentrus centrarchus]|uniref:low affinity immunoglobulin gamma Fc region receptor III-like n=1 Tax=Archocentrus centrarchus TaxID=63155 RepID=UPI0011EA3A3C|nr:low affinity immunoglobulin gamma Fc region receptor III-like [Archocentrus centrarchus]
MEFRALCVSMLTAVMILLCAHDQKADAVSLHVVPNRSQFFEYESVTFHCKEVSDYNVVHKYKSCRKGYVKTATGSSCTIRNVYPEDSGEYWCETGGGKRSNSINISVTAGSVILESPAVPVLEGEAVTLRCRNKTTSSNFTADFYKDGLHISSSSTGSMSIHRASRLHEGVYKCNISGAGESPESWLNVTVDSVTDSGSNEEESHPPSDATPWIIVTALLSAVLVIWGLHHFGKGYWDRALLCLSAKMQTSGSAADQTEANAADAGNETHAAVTKNRKTDDDGLSSKPIYSLLGPGDTQIEDLERSTSTRVSSSGLYHLVAEDPFYSTIQRAE